MTRKCKCFSTKWCIYYCKKFGKNIIHLVVTNLEWIKVLIWKTVNMTIEWSNEYTIIDPGTWFIFRKFSSFIKRIASPRIMVYSFNGVPKPWCTEILNCLGPLTSSMCNWATDRRLLFIVRYFSTMCVDVVWYKLYLRFGWIFTCPLRIYHCPGCNEKGTVSNIYILSPQCSNSVVN